MAVNKPALPQNLVDQLIGEAGLIYAINILEGKSEGEAFNTTAGGE